MHLIQEYTSRIMFRKVCCLVVILALGANAGEPEKLVGAKNANIGEFPYQVSLRLNGRHFCGGSLISTKHVLTAAHCILPVKNKINNVVAVVGTNSLNSGGNRYYVKDMSAYPKYVDKNTPDWMYDIGVITLTTDVQLSSRVSVVKLPTKDVQSGDKPTVSGWGTMVSPFTPLSQSLQKLTVNVISYETCKKSMPSFASVDPTQVCTFVKKGSGACSGDSGGPLVLDGVVVGVVSGGIPCAIGYPDVFTNVYKYIGYIKGIINK